MAGKNKIIWYADRDNGKFRSFVNNLVDKTNVSSTLYNGNIIYNISPNGKITTKFTRNFHELTIDFFRNQ